MRVLAALSGGVDSALACALAVEAGHDVTAVHMALSSQPAQCRIGSRGCCSVEDAGDAARAAETLGVPFYVWDLAEEFEQTVISDFVDQYKMGHTPNPCVRCNEFVKFKELADRAQALGFDAVCTGHYAQIVDGVHGPELHRARDEAKDQSYVLAVMGEDELTRVFLPLGSAPSKAWVRVETERRGLGVSGKPDSFDICFIPDGDTQGFLQARLGKNVGKIVSDQGEVLGEHNGYWNFTIGQRRGLRIERPADDGRPRYVVRTDPTRNEVIVGASELLSVDTIETSAPIWLAKPHECHIDLAATEAFGKQLGQRALADIPSNVLTAQIRAHGIPSVVEDLVVRNDGMRVVLAEPIRGVAAGQSLVLYRGTRVMAEATITQSYRRTRMGEQRVEVGAGI